MTREQYITFKENNSIELLYEYYKEKIDRNKHKELDANTFFQTIVQWPPVNDAYRSVVAYFDVKFEIATVKDLATGHIFKIY